MSASEISPETFARAGFAGYQRDAQGRWQPVPAEEDAPPDAMTLFWASLVRERLPTDLVDAYLELAAQIGVREAREVRRECREYGQAHYLPEEEAR